jgi:hypothetical protein
MKQGSAPTKQESHKIEPKSHSINPTYVAQLGAHVGHHADKGDLPYKTESMHKGQTLKAPMSGHQTHHSGSQGKHR